MLPRILGSVFRNKLTYDKDSEEIEETIAKSGLWGKDPTKVVVVRQEDPWQYEYEREQMEKESHIPLLKTSSRATNQVTPSNITTNRPQTQKNYVQQILSSRRPKSSQSDYLTPRDPVDAPNVFFWKVLGENEPPTESNFKQLEEMLERLIEKGNTSIDFIFYHIFGGIAQQYGIECSAQAEVLVDCRNYFDFARLEIPKIYAYYNNKLEVVRQKALDLLELANKFKIETEENRKMSEELSRTIAEIKQELSIIISHHDNLVKQIAIAQQEAAEMKKEVIELADNLKIKSHLLAQLNDELRSLDIISAQYTQDLLRCAEDIVTLREQCDKLKSKVIQARAKISDIRKIISNLDKDIQELSSALIDARKVPDKNEIVVQCDMISRRFFNETKTKSNSLKMNTKLSRGRKKEETFKRFVELFNNASSKKNNGKIIINGYEDMAILKRLIMENDDVFRIPEELVELAYKGDFNLYPLNEDYCRLFAHSVVSRAVERAIRKHPQRSISTQTVVKKVQLLSLDESALKQKMDGGFLGLLKSDFSTRQPKHLSWLLSEINTLYDLKAIENEKYISKHEIPPPFHASIFEHAKNVYKLEFVADQYCWDLYNTVHEHLDRCLWIEMFSAFIEEIYSAEQMAFFLRARQECMKIGAPVPVKTRDQLEVYNEYYLSEDQIENELIKWWADRYQKKFLADILAFSIARPTVHLESTKRYVSMSDILCKSVQEYFYDNIRRLDEHLKEYRIIPRVTYDHFEEIVKELIPHISNKQVGRIHRSTVKKSRQRTCVDIYDFKDVFKRECLLFKQSFEDTSTKNIQLSTIIHSSVSSLWFRYKSRLLKLIEYFRVQTTLHPSNLILKIYYDYANRLLSMFTHALSTHDGSGCCIYLFKLVANVDIMYSTFRQIDPDLISPTLLSMECGIRENWLESIMSR